MMSENLKLPPLDALGGQVGALLRARGQTVAVAESAAGGLVSAALLAIPGASAFFVGGAIVYSKAARRTLLGIFDGGVLGFRAETEPYASLIAQRLRIQLGATWGLGESGAAGPKGSPYGDAPGHLCVAVDGPTAVSRTIETAVAERVANMELFARHLLALFLEVLTSEA